MDNLNKIIPFHKHASKPVINWDRLELIRATTYPRISPKVLALIRESFESPTKTSFHLTIDDYDDGYPPDPIDVAPLQGDAIWIMDLLDRYGGTLECCDKVYTVRRKKKKSALFVVLAVSPGTRLALCNAIGPLYEHYVESRTWRVLGRDLTDKLVFFLITNLSDEDKIYLGLFDRKTALMLFERMACRSIENVLGL